MAIPSAVREIINVQTLGEMAARIDPAMKSAPPHTSVARLPARSAKTPHRTAPAIDPTRTTLTTTSSISVDREKVARTKISAAAMIAISKP